MNSFQATSEIRNVRVIGIGDSSRRDSEAGPAAAKQVGLLNPRIEVIECPGDGMMILDLLANSTEVFIIGAISSGGTKGSYLRFDVNHDPLPSRLLYASRHLFGVMEALELARTFHRLPTKCILMGIVGGDFSRGEGMDREVRLACKTVAEAITNELSVLTDSSIGNPTHA